MDPPAYTPTQPAAPTTTKRSIEDTRALILCNAQIIKPRHRVDGNIMLVVGKTRPPIPQGQGSGVRTFTHSTSNTTIRIAEPTEAGSRRPSAADLSLAPAQRQQGKHYAALVAKGNAQIQQILRGEPQDTVEEALEWMLDRTEIIVAEMLEKHGKQMTSGCCTGCDGMLGGLPPVKVVDRTQLAGWLQNE